MNYNDLIVNFKNKEIYDKQCRKKYKEECKEKLINYINNGGTYENNGSVYWTIKSELYVYDDDKKELNKEILNILEEKLKFPSRGYIYISERRITWYPKKYSKCIIS